MFVYSVQNCENYGTRVVVELTPGLCVDDDTLRMFATGAAASHNPSVVPAWAEIVTMRPAHGSVGAQAYIRVQMTHES